MYVYPNGLKCDASPARVKLYESVVPFLAIAVSLAGFIGIAVWGTGKGAGVGYAVMSLWLGAAWVLLCVAAAYGIFVVWCRPVRGVGDPGA